MAKTTSTKVQKVSSALQNPTVQRILAWLLPVVIGWVLSKFDKKSDNSTKKK